MFAGKAEGCLSEATFFCSTLGCLHDIQHNDNQTKRVTKLTEKKFYKIGFGVDAIKLFWGIN
jgi:hypothetical protein